MMSLATEDSLNQSIKKAHRHYSSLFFLPSFKNALVGVALMSLIAGVVSVFFYPSVEGLVVGLVLGVSIFLLNFLVDWVISGKILRDAVFVLRRVVVLSFFAWIFWLAVIAVGVVLGLAFGAVWWVKLCLLGFAVLVTLRTVVLFSVASANLANRVLAVLLQPFACIVPFAVFWYMRGVALIDFVPFLIVSPFIAMVFAYLFIRVLDRMGQEANGLSSITLFKAFMLNWVAALNGPLESFLEELGEDADVEVSLLKFDSTKPKAAFVVPLVHPGPFKNIGSSLLPSLLKENYEREIGGDTCVPLGLLGHELDAASQAQNEKIIGYVLQRAKFDASIDKATPLVRVSEGFVTVSCQVFGKTAFLSFTLAPKTTEDLPQELGSIVQDEAQKLGLDFAVVVNAHNSLTENTQIEASLETLSHVASKCLQKAVAQQAYPFEVGSATLYPAEFSLKDGMGTGGITAIVVKVALQNIAYVVVDGNNMVSGLREKILSALESAGFQMSEVFTTDTHAVSAVVVGPRGYHPVGEAMNPDRLIANILEVTKKAAASLESCRAGYLSMTVPKIRVIGGECLESISLLVDKTIQKAKRIIVPVFAVEGLLLILFLALL
jgi:putative membrane protein